MKLRDLNKKSTSRGTLRGILIVRGALSRFVELSLSAFQNKYIINPFLAFSAQTISFDLCEPIKLRLQNPVNMWSATP
jgi:hypothetical protein